MSSAPTEAAATRSCWCWPACCDPCPAGRSGYFTFYRDCPADVDIVPGDARLTLARSEDRFGVLVIDAFSSDAIPVHLLTREALEVYRSRLAPNGVLAFNITNRYLDLKKVLGDLAASFDPPLACWVEEDPVPSARLMQDGKATSTWVVMAETKEALAKVMRDPRWEPLAGRPGAAVWSDDYSNLFRVFGWQ